VEVVPHLDGLKTPGNLELLNFRHKVRLSTRDYQTVYYARKAGVLNYAVYITIQIENCLEQSLEHE